LKGRKARHLPERRRGLEYDVDIRRQNMKNINRYVICILFSLACSNGINDMSDRMQSTAEPEINPASGTYASDISVTMSCTTSGAIIYYTTDGSTPTASSSVYVAPVSVSGDGTSMTIRAMAAKTGMVDSTTAQTSYVISYPAAPSPSAVAGYKKITLSWSPVAGATSYNIYWSNSPGVTKATGNKITNASSPYVHSSLANWTKYYYVMTTVNPLGLESVVSPESSTEPGLMAMYVVNNGGGVSAYTITYDNGAPVVIAGSPFSTGANPFAVAVSPSNKFVYVTNWSSSTISGFSINNTTGALTSLTPSTYNAGISTYWPSYLAVNPSSSLLYVLCSNNNALAAYTVAADGSLSLITVYSPASYPVSIQIDSSGKYLYHANANSNTLYNYTIGSGGTLSSSVTTSIAYLSPSALAIDSTHNILYVVNSGSKNIVAYAISTSDGTLSALSGFPMSTGTTPNSIAIDPTGKFLYVANKSDNNISGYTIGSAGTLTAMSATFSAGTNPCSIAVDPCGKYVYAVNYGGGISAYTITATGALSPITGPFNAGTQPQWITVTKLP
jgi:6-phosphogluconolactonase (cycloisomerase 2 family)